jgi:hypothetical protein
MDVNKWKSVAVRKETHTLLTALCNETERNPARMISKLVNDYVTYQAEKKKMSKESYMKKLLNGTK